MNKLLVSLFVIFTVFSCGKNNSVGTQQGVVSNGYASVAQDSRFQALSTLVTSNQFYVGNVNYYTEYHYADIVNTCVTKDGWFGQDYLSCTTSKSNETIKYHGQINVDERKNALIAILNKTVVISQLSYVYTVRTTDNITYVIDARVPLQANPVYTYDNATSKGNGLVSIK